MRQKRGQKEEERAKERVEGAMPKRVQKRVLRVRPLKKGAV